MFINYTNIISSFINNIKSIFSINYDDSPFNTFKIMFGKIYNERCKTIIGEYQPDVLPPVENIYVIGDIHGDYEKLIQLLSKANVIKIEILNNNNTNTNIDIININGNKVIQDNNNIIKWIGEDSVIVQVGDQIDRCRDINNCRNSNYDKDDKNNDWKILKFMTLLNELAKLEGGYVYSLLGNHEIMNAESNFKYVSKKGLDDFSRDYDKNYLQNFNNNNNNIVSREQVFKIGNEISNFLACTRKLCIIIGSNVFVHGGISSSIAYKYRVSDMNKIVSLYLFDSLKLSDLENNHKLKKFADNAINDLLHSNESPLWNRDLNNFLLDININNNIPKWVQNININNCNKLSNDLNMFILKSSEYIVTPLKEDITIKVGNIIVGHTPQLNTGHINSRCNNKVWITDYGSSIAFKKYKKNIVPEIQILHINKDVIFRVIS